ncbi:MAG: aryl-sulfate sulfotransferase [Phycisphaerales bacterium]|nr:aryl-sulfate sulfotransferase [Phycisphaerales bacterium]
MEPLKRGAHGLLEFPCDVERLPNGNTLIADAGDEDGSGSEIIEVDPFGNIVWNYRGGAVGLLFAHSAKRLKNGNTLISDTSHSRILEVNPKGEIVFTSDSWNNGTGKLSDGSHLHYPNDAHLLEDEWGGGTIIITDRNNDRCVITDYAGNVKWFYDRDIKHPHNCDMLPNGNVIIADSDGKRIVEVNREKQIVWEYHPTAEGQTLDWPRDADRLPNGNVLITDSKNSRVIEITPDGQIVWCYRVSYFANFYDSDKLPNGNVLISDQQRHQVLEVDPYGNVVWQFRNYRNFNSINRTIKNGSFSKLAPNGLPEHWIIFNRFSEGGGEFAMDPAVSAKPVPRLTFDRAGAYLLKQSVAVIPGTTYKMSATVKTQNLQDGAFAYLQMAFVDAFGALIEDAAKAPKGNFFTGENDWTEDSFDATAPATATAVEIRFVLTGPGKGWVRNVMFFAN